MKLLNNTMRLMLLALLAAVACQTARAQDGDMPDFAFASQEPLETEKFDSKQHNKWARSTNFARGIKAMDDAINSDGDSELDVYDKAITCFNKEIKQHPSNGYALCNLALCQYHRATIALNKYLVELLDSAAEQGPGDDEMMANLEAIYQEAGETMKQSLAQAIDNLDKGMALLPVPDRQSRCDARIVMSEMLKSIDADESEQLKWLNDAVVLHPCEKSYTKILEFYSDNDDDDQVERIAREAADFIPYHPAVRIYQAMDAAERGDYAHALAIIDDLINDDPNDKDILQVRASINFNAKNYKAAVDDFINMANYEKITDVHTPLAAIAIASGDIDMVIDAVKQQQERDDDEDLPVNWWLAEAMLQSSVRHDYHKALDCAHQALRVSNDNSVKAFTAEQHYLLGDVDKALYILNEAAHFDNEGEALNRKMEIEMNCGMASEMISDASALLSMGIEPMMPVGYSYRAWAHSALGDWKSAIADYDEWMQHDEDNVMPRYYRARALVLAGQQEQGRDELEQILATHSFDDNEELKMNVLYYLGRTDESLAILRKLTANSEMVAAMTDEQKASADTLPEVMTPYNLACAWSLHGDSDQCFNFLKHHFDGDSDDAINYGYAVLDYDFDNVRQNPEFLRIINDYKKRWLNGGYKPSY